MRKIKICDSQYDTDYAEVSAVGGAVFLDVFTKGIGMCKDETGCIELEPDRVLELIEALESCLEDAKVQAEQFKKIMEEAHGPKPSVEKSGT